MDYNITSATTLHCNDSNAFLVVVRPVNFNTNEYETIPKELLKPTALPSPVKQPAPQPSYTSTPTPTLILTPTPTPTPSTVVKLPQPTMITVLLTWDKLRSFSFRKACLLSEVFNTFSQAVLKGKSPDEYRLVKHTEPNKILPLDKSLEELGIVNNTIFTRKY